MYKQQCKVSSFKFQVVLFISSLLLISGCARKTPDKLFQDAQEAYQQKDLTNATIKLEDFLERYPHDPRAVSAQYGWAEIQALQGKNKQAMEGYTKVIKNYPADSQFNYRAKFNIANIYAQSSSYDKARDLWAELAKDTTRPVDELMCYFNTGLTYEEEKNYSKAEETYIICLKSVPFTAKQLKLPEKDKRAMDYLQNFNDNQIIECTERLAMVNAKQGKLDKAAAVYSSLLSRNTTSEQLEGNAINFQLKAGDLYRDANQPKKALEYYNKGIVSYAKITADQKNPDKAAWATTKIAEVYELHMKDTAKAVTTYQGLIKNYPKARWTKHSQEMVNRLTGAQNTAKPLAPPAGAINTTKK